VKPAPVVGKFVLVRNRETVPLHVRYAVVEVIPVIVRRRETAPPHVNHAVVEGRPVFV
jgi:hypothetical protein